MADAPRPARRHRALTLVGAVVAAPLATLAFSGSDPAPPTAAAVPGPAG